MKIIMIIGLSLSLLIVIGWSIIAQDKIDNLEREKVAMSHILAQRDREIDEMIAEQEKALAVLKDVITRQAGAMAIMEAEARQREIEALQREATIEELRDELNFELGEDLPVLPRVNSPFPFDCDDATLYMFHFFTARDYEIQVVVGNLELENETFWQCNHVWLWVRGDNGYDYPYDWGVYMPDKQHRFGYVVDYERLLREAFRDQN